MVAAVVLRLVRNLLLQNETSIWTTHFTDSVAAQSFVFLMQNLKKLKLLPQLPLLTGQVVFSNLNIKLAVIILL